MKLKQKSVPYDEIIQKILIFARWCFLYVIFKYNFKSSREKIDNLLDSGFVSLP